MKQLTERPKLPSFFKPLFWSYKFSSIDPERDKRCIVINTINYGRWEHWLWILGFYGKSKVKEMIEKTPKSEFREPALKLASLLFGVQKLEYVSRSDYIQSQKGLQ